MNDFRFFFESHFTWIAGYVSVPFFEHIRSLHFIAH